MSASLFAKLSLKKNVGSFSTFLHLFLKNKSFTRGYVYIYIFISILIEHFLPERNIGGEKKIPFLLNFGELNKNIRQIILQCSSTVRETAYVIGSSRNASKYIYILYLMIVHFSRANVQYKKRTNISYIIISKFHFPVL